jgi:hypothetical protein
MKDWNHLFDFIALKHFRLVAQSTPPQPFGNYYYTFSNGNVNIQVVQDRGQLSILICAAADSDWWFSMRGIKFLLDGGEYDISLDIEDAEIFFIQNFDRIISMFRTDKYEFYKSQWINFSKESYRKLYGNDVILPAAPQKEQKRGEEQ